MKVYYDFQILLMQKYGGISRYFFEVISRLNNMNVDVDVHCLHSINYYFRDQIKVVSSSWGMNIPAKIKRRIYRYMNTIKALWDIRKGYDIIHPTYYYHYMLGHYSGKLVVTVHDMIHEKYGGDRVTIENKRIMLHAADRLIAVSENTKHDITDIYPDISPDKISVIYHGNSMTIKDNIEPAPIEKPYILFVGGRGWYKNFPRFFKAMIPILDMYPELQVLCVGDGAFRKNEIEMMGEKTNRFHQYIFNDDELARAYSNAECFVFPSEYEGFGIPLLEAFACNCPVICSRASSFPEVAGDAAEYFDPLDIDEMSAKILSVLESDTVRKRLRTAGRERLKLFEWDKTIYQTLECYRQAIAHN